MRWKPMMAIPRWNKGLIRATSFVAACLTSVLILPQTANASWLDTDPVCTQFGCVIVHNGVNFQVYDNYDASNGRTLRPGEPLILRTAPVSLPVGQVNPVITGSLDEALTAAPLADQGTMLGIDTNGDGVGDTFPLDGNGSGFLDAGDSLDVFAIDTNTSIAGAATSYQRSFYVTSSTDFMLTAQAIPGAVGSGVTLAGGLSSIGFTYRLQPAGNDGGLQFGKRAQKGNVNRPVGAVTNIGDLLGRPVDIFEFRKEIAKKNAATLAEQSVRFDYVYDFGGYDMSMGDGDLNFQVEFDFYAR